MNPMSRARYTLARRPWLYWLAVGTLAALAGLLVAGAVTGVDEARRRWGAERTVLVAGRDGRPGEPVEVVTVARSLPAPAVPDAALTTAPAGAVLRQHVAAGEVVSAPDIAASAAPQALIGEGRQAVAVVERVPTGAVVGDEVAVASGGIVLAARATVVGAHGEAVLVAVPADEAPAVAAAAATDDVALLLQP